MGCRKSNSHLCRPPTDTYDNKFKNSIFFKFHHHLCRPLLIAARGGPPLPPLPRYATDSLSICSFPTSSYQILSLFVKQFGRKTVGKGHRNLWRCVLTRCCSIMCQIWSFWVKPYEHSNDQAVKFDPSRLDFQGHSKWPRFENRWFRLGLLLSV